MNGYWSLDKPIEVHCHNDTQLTISFQNFYVTQHYFKFARGGGDYRFIKAVGCASVNYEGSVQLSVNQTIIAY